MSTVENARKLWINWQDVFKALVGFGVGVLTVAYAMGQQDAKDEARMQMIETRLVQLDREGGSALREFKAELGKQLGSIETRLTENSTDVRWIRSYLERQR